jgi:hypothetical protein
MIFKEIDLSNLDISLKCLIGLGIFTVIYLLCKLITSDDGFSIPSKRSYNKSTSKGGLVYKTNWNCEEC